MNRRQFASLLLAGAALSACAPGGALTPPADPNAPAPATGTAATIAGKFQTIVDAFRNVIPDLGLTGGTLDKVTGEISSLAGVASSILSGGGSLSSLVTNGAGIIKGVADVLSIAGVVTGPYGLLITAAVNAIPIIMQLAGIGGRASPALYRLAGNVTIKTMAAGEAEATLRYYALRSRLN